MSPPDRNRNPDNPHFPPYVAIRAYYTRASLSSSPWWGAADAEIKVSSDETTELKRSPFKVWSRSVYSMLSLLPGIFSSLISTLPVHSPAFFPKPLPIFFPVLALANTGSCVGPQNKIGHPVGCRFPCWVPAEYKSAKTWLVVWWIVKWMTWT